jgi:hypothetical protein
LHFRDNTEGTRFRNIVFSQYNLLYNKETAKPTRPKQ